MILMCLINFVYQVYFVNDIMTDYCSFFYSSVPIIIYVISVFIYILSKKVSSKNKIVKTLSNMFLLVFTIHSFFIGRISLLLGDIMYFGPILVWLAVTIISIFVSWILLKLPYANKIFKI